MNVSVGRYTKRGKSLRSSPAERGVEKRDPEAPASKLSHITLHICTCRSRYVSNHVLISPSPSMQYSSAVVVVGFCVGMMYVSTVGALSFACTAMTTLLVRGDNKVAILGIEGCCFFRIAENYLSQTWRDRLVICLSIQRKPIIKAF